MLSLPCVQNQLLATIKALQDQNQTLVETLERVKEEKHRVVAATQQSVSIATSAVVQAEQELERRKETIRVAMKIAAEKEVTQRANCACWLCFALLLFR